MYRHGKVVKGRGKACPLYHPSAARRPIGSARGGGVVCGPRDWLVAMFGIARGVKARE